MPASCHELEIVRGHDPAVAMLHPLRRRILSGLREPQSAAGLSRKLDQPRQKINYHLRELEKARLVKLVGERKQGNCVERLFRASARAYVISPETLGPLAADPTRLQDRFSSSYLTALAAKSVQELGQLRAGADAAGQRLPTLSLQAEVRFASPAKRRAFAEALAEQVARLVTQYHDDTAEDGRTFKFFVGGYPKPKPASPNTQDTQDEAAHPGES